MKSSTTVPFVVLMLVLQVMAVAVAWVAKVLSTESTSAFAVLIAADLIAFMVVVQVYRDPRSIESGTTTTPKEHAASPPPAQASPAPSPSPGPAQPSPPKQNS